ncbi:MAG: peptide chain release factor N(5)-glutamine methyltransferase [Betaproteobacteria bacterium]|jgi:release factor glutamine methyltransferase
MPTSDILLEEAACQLVGNVDARREAQVLLGIVLGVSRAWLAAHGGKAVDPLAAATFHSLVERRRAGEPIAYLLGRREFYGLDFRVTPDVLIPRADTETLVDAALEVLDRDAAHDVLDLGTGSGCVAVVIAHERPVARVTALDASASALKIAGGNALAHGVNVAFVRGNWLEPLAGRRFDLIVSNPPYVAAGDPHLRSGDLRFEPQQALASGIDGLRDIRKIVAAAPACLRAGGWLLLEHGHDQAKACRDLLLDTGFTGLISRPDLAGLARVAGGRLLTEKSAYR